MIKYFKWSILIMIIGLICSFFWGEHILLGSGLKTVSIVLFLSILEITLSFDNAIINAIRLQKMSEVWKKIFLTLGILIAVFGVRLVLPIIIITIFSRHPILNVLDMALHDANTYAEYLHVAHLPLVTFGGIFLVLIFYDFFFDKDKETFWIEKIEKPLSKVGKIPHSAIIFGIITLGVLCALMPQTKIKAVLMSGLGGIITYALINGICSFLEKIQKNGSKLKTGFQVGLFNFLYLELIDASFSFDGLLGAFAISKDIIIIMIGLGIGAMFVRSLTIFMVEHKTLDKYIFLENGAHFAIGFLALVMFISTKTEVPEWVTGTFSLLIIILSLISSIKHKHNA